MCGVLWDRSKYQRKQHYTDSSLDLHWLTRENKRSFLNCCQTYKIWTASNTILIPDARLDSCGLTHTHFYSTVMCQCNQTFLLHQPPPPLYGTSYPTIVSSSSINAHLRPACRRGLRYFVCLSVCLFVCCQSTDYLRGLQSKMYIPAVFSPNVADF